nr:RecName: Full=Ent-atiserene synthase KSL1, chloroplastic; Flags: Precursor [Isodon japonicus]
LVKDDMSLILSSFSLFRSSRSSPASASLAGSGHPRTTPPKIASLQSPMVEETKERIAKLFKKKEVSRSTYDTAWVGMVPSPFSSEEPCFPDCLFWLLQNQCPDGSWAQPHHHSLSPSLLNKDVLSSTLASILALQKWGLGQRHIAKGLHFLELNFASATDNSQITPLGFDIVFPAMLDYAADLSLNLRLDPTTLNDLMNRRDSELKRCTENGSAETEVYLAYIGEGMGKLHDWETVMKYQRKNGSLFNSPSTTAAAFIALGNSDCLKYLNSALKKFGSAVPAVYPLDIYSQLCIVDNLERLGISRFFSTEIQSVLDDTYRCWLQGDEEIFMDASTCGLAFRTLRMNGYKVTSDSFIKVVQDCFSSSSPGHMRDVNTTLELYRASELMLYPHEIELEKQNSRLRSLLEQELSGGSIQSSQLNAEVKQALDYPFYAVLDRMAKKKTIEHYNIDDSRILKTSFCLPSFGNKDLLSLSVQDYNRCQAIHREELREFDRWFVENRLDELEFARHKSAYYYCYFAAAATFFAPELSDARMSWAKNALMTTMVDDLFDVTGSVEEMKNLIQLVELWDVDVSTECRSHKVQILFSALKRTICEVGDRAHQLQGRSIRSHIIVIWLDLLHSMMKEVEWSRDKFVPTMDEYVSNAYVSFALGPIVLPALYLVGPKLSEEMVNHSEYHNLFKLMSMCGRLLNDIRGYEREHDDGKLNAMSLYIMNNGGEITPEVAIMEIKSWNDRQRRELLRLVLEEKSVIPKACKDLFWHMCSVVHLFYNKDDGFWSQELIEVVNQVIHQPILLSHF